MEIVEDFVEKSYDDNGKPKKSSRILCPKPNFFFFFILRHGSSFFHVSPFFFIYVHFSSFFDFSIFSFFHCLIFSFFALLSFYFSCFPFFSCFSFFHFFICFTISDNITKKKLFFLSRLGRVYPFEASFPFLFCNMFFTSFFHFHSFFS